MTDHVRLTKAGALATLVIDRPDKRNAMSLAMWEDLPALAKEVEGDSDVKVLVVRGAGHGPFCSGADITEFAALRMGVENGRRYSAAIRVGQRAVADLPVPTIAMICGFCIGGGSGLALACDIRVCEEGARFGVTPAKLGVVYSLTSTKRLVDAVGPSWAKQLLFTGDLVDAATALRIGLVNEVHPLAELEPRTYALAQRIATRASSSIRGSKEITSRVMAGQAVDDDEVQTLYDASYTSPDYTEGIRAFLEKRPPRFS